VLPNLRGFDVNRFRFNARRAGAVIASCLLPIGAYADQRLWDNETDGYSITRDSIVIAGAAPVDQELADDFT